MSLLVTCAVGLILKSTAKRYVTAGAQRSQRKMRCRVLTRMRRGAYVSFLQFSALPASQRCACAGHVTAEAQCSQRKMRYAANGAAMPRPYGHLRVAYHASVSSVLVNCWSNI